MKIIYITSAGRSGSTVLDIVLGNFNGVFSTGELNNLISHGIMNDEFCSCNQKVRHCEFWSGVMLEWDKKRELPLFEYQKIVHKYLRNKGTLLLLKQMILPNLAFKQAISDTKLLFHLIGEKSGCSTIVDSSKSAQRLLFLRMVECDLTVVRLKRSLQGVLKSTKKVLKKDLSRGIEQDFNPQSTFYSISNWAISLILGKLFSLGLNTHFISFEELTSDPCKALKLLCKQENIRNPEMLLKRGPFFANHLCAGNRMRMSEQIWLKESVKERGDNLSKSDRCLLNFLSKIGVQ